MDLASKNFFSAGVKGAKLSGDTINHLVKNAKFYDEEMKKVNEWNESHDYQGRSLKKATPVVLLI